MVFYPSPQGPAEGKAIMSVAQLPRLGLIAALLISGPAAVAGTSPVAPGASEFRRAGGGLACITPEQPDEALRPPYRACLRIGPVRIGQSLRDVAMMFGDPYRVVARGDTTFRVYTIDIGAPEGQPVPYWVIGFDADRRVVSIQLTGERGDKNLAFSSIRLGDPARRVVSILGEPSVNREVGDIDGAEYWGYAPFPISIEIKNRRVYSIRVSEAADK